MSVLALALDPYVRDWLDLLVRWLHVIAAIGWIGSSFYFVLLDQSLQKPKDPADEEAGVGGELWEVHGGGFYHVQKYKVAPKALPEHLAWFKWEAYATWLSGFALLVILFWFDAPSYMIDTSVAKISATKAVVLSALGLVVAWIVYDVLCRVFKKADMVLAVLLAGGIVVAAWWSAQYYAPRAAWLQTGAMLGTIMAANVLFNIIPAHWELIRAKEADRDPDPAPGLEAKRRSVHNNYFTLPVLVAMLAGHFSFLTGKEHSWMILLFLMALGAWVRHFYNLRHRGTTYWWMPAVAAVAIAVLAVALSPDDKATTATSSKAASAIDGAKVFSANCASCHTLSAAKSRGAVGPNLDTSKPDAALVINRVSNGKGGMRSFRSQLSDNEISAVAAYVARSTHTR